jgi:hypothetical protein
MVGGTTTTAHEMVMKMSKKRTDIPNPHAPGALAVTDGGTCIGYIVHAGAYIAFGADDVLVGEFDTQGKAMRALPAASTRKSSS